MDTTEYPDRQTLYINRSDSFCGACRGGADPHEQGHLSLRGYGIRHNQSGCGAVWTKVSTENYGMGMNEVIATMRPDLEVVPLL